MDSFMSFVANKEAREKVSKYINKGITKTGVIVELKKPTIKKEELKELFIVWSNYEEDHPYIIKCPIIGSTQRTYIINVKDRNRYGKYEHYTKLKIFKKDINDNFRYKASTTYNMAFSFLLMQEQWKILGALQDKNDIDLYRLYTAANEFDFLLGLEIIARELKMDYLFRLDDDTKLEKEIF